MKSERINIVKVLAFLIGVILIIRLFTLQVIDGKGYLAISSMRATSIITTEAPRGVIKDRNGKDLVTNREGYKLLWIKTAASDDEVNGMLLRLFDILASEGHEFVDSLPISAYPFEFTFETDEEKNEWFKSKKRLKSNMTASEVIDYYRDEVFMVKGDIEPNKLRALIGVRYDAEMNGFSYSIPYTIANDVGIEVVTKVKEQSAYLPDIEVEREYIRQFEYGSLAAHTLGRTGKIYKEEYEELKEKGYSFDDYVGKQGVEKICEDYLKGIDGQRILGAEDTKELLGIEEKKSEAGNYVVLTIDSDIQMAAEESLKKTIEEIAANGVDKGPQKGADCTAGAAVVMDVNSGEVLALATYPSYNPETFNEMYAELSQDDTKPLWNRAISGTYEPGSTFKPLTAIAALETGAVTTEEVISCTGIYRFFRDYQPKCWIYLDYGLSHGGETVTKAIEDSCNVYFYEIGRRTGITALAEYAKKFGLGEYTGIELTEEAKGSMATPEYKEQVDKENSEWYGGDTIQAAIGQSLSHFTPLQLTNYIATIANGGTRYRPHIIKSVHRSSDGVEIMRNDPVIEERISITQENLSAVKRGMYGVVDEGSASKAFRNYDIEVGGKTGTAQGNSDESNTALFVAFAPYDKPEIAVCVVLEHGVRGVNAAPVARDIFDAYFHPTGENAEYYSVGTLLP
ncbi:MAG: penicillin-binding transpeptidase domain-containing protein [Clostridia bacterium]|nr:penicillin-binding transpeptidase domain-containing protein [Clostridia bacterium]